MRRWAGAVMMVAATCGWPAARAAAQQPPAETRQSAPEARARVRALHAGLHARTDLGTHPLRASLGAQLGPWNITAVLDPIFLSDGQHDLDLLVEHLLGGSRFSLLAGWRVTMIDVAGGQHRQQRPLVGLTAALPTLASGRLRSHWSLELATLLVKEGGGVGTEWIALDRGLIDHLALGMFVRIEYAIGL